MSRVKTIWLRGEGTASESFLDDVDKEILNRLQDDARASFAEIGRSLGIGESTVRFRYGRLLKNGIIQRVTALVEPRKIGLPITAVLMVKCDARKVDPVAHNISKIQEAHHVIEGTGEHDLVVMVHCRDMSHMNEVTRKVKAVSGVVNTQVTLMTRPIKVETKFKL